MNSPSATREEIIPGGVSSVAIHGDTVTKTYTLKDDKMSCSNAPFMTTEVAILSLLNGYNGFPQLTEIRCQPPNYSLVMPYLGEPLDPREYRISWLVQILRLLAVLHKHDIVHCDLKPENILIDEHGNISIIDFSHSYIMSNYNAVLTDKHGRMHFDPSGQHQLGGPDASGTHIYIAPEAYTCTYAKTSAIDIWSFGCLIYELLTDATLFTKRGFSPRNYYEGIALMKLNHAYMSDIPEKINRIVGHETEKNLLHTILVKDPEHRPNACKLLSMLGQEYKPPQLYDVNRIPCHFPSLSRLRCYDLPPYLQTYVDNLFDYCLGRVVCDRFELLYAIHYFVAWVFVSKSCEFDPSEALQTGQEYMKILTTMVKTTNFRVMYDKEFE